MALMGNLIEEQLASFEKNGFVVVHNALTSQEMASIDAGIEADRAAHPVAWEPGPREGHIAVGCDAPEIMERTDALDLIPYHPAVMPLIDRLLRPGARMSGLTYMRRDPCLVPRPADLADADPLCLERHWHREDGGNVEGAENSDYYVSAIQTIYYLDDVDAESHCFSVIPESAETKRKLPKITAGGKGWGGTDRLRIHDSENGYVDPDQAKWVDAFGRELPKRLGGVDVHAPAGSAVLFNNSSYHCGTIRHTNRQRRTVHIRYRQSEPVESRHAIKPPWNSVAEFLASLPQRSTFRSP